MYKTCLSVSVPMSDRSDFDKIAKKEKVEKGELFSKMLFLYKNRKEKTTNKPGASPSHE